MEPTIEQSLLQDENGRALVRLASRRSFCWDEFLELPLPKTMGAKQTWRALHEWRKPAGVSLPFVAEGVDTAWYSMTLELADLAARIERDCSAGSDLAHTLAQASGQHFLMQMRIADTLSALELDGLEIGSEEVEGLLIYGRTPKGSAARFVKNTFEADNRLADYAGEPFSLDLVREIGHLITDGVDLDEIGEKPRNLGMVPFDYAERTRRQGDMFVQQLIDYANDVNGDVYDRPVLRCTRIENMVYSHQPFGKASGQIGRLMAHLYALKHDLPVLAFLPISKARVQWSKGLVKRPDVACSHAELMATAEVIFGESDVDATLEQVVLAQLTCHLIDELRKDVDVWRSRDEEVRRVLQHDIMLNQRQRAIIARALRRPDATFTIKYHQTNHAIAYATARRDLMELTDKGYLTFDMVGKAMVFRADPSLQGRVGKE